MTDVWIVSESDEEGFETVLSVHASFITARDSVENICFSEGIDCFWGEPVELANGDYMYVAETKEKPMFDVSYAVWKEPVLP